MLIWISFIWFDLMPLVDELDCMDAIFICLNNFANNKIDESGSITCDKQ